MKYTYFEIENFKGIKKLRLDFDTSPKGPIYTLVGLNESGKTTILEALAYFKPGIHDIDPMDVAGIVRPDPHQLIPVAQRGNYNGDTVIRAGIELNDDDISALTRHLKERPHQINVSEVSRSFSVADTYSFENSAFKSRRATWSDFSLKGRTSRGVIERPLFSSHRAAWRSAADFLTARMPSIWFFPNFLFDFPSRIYLNAQKGETNPDRFYRALLGDILEVVDPTANIQEHLADRAATSKPPDQTALRQLLLEMSRRVTQDVFNSWNKIFNRPFQTRALVGVDIEGDEGPYAEVTIEDSDGNLLPRRALPRVSLVLRILVVDNLPGHDQPARQRVAAVARRARFESARDRTSAAAG